MIVDQILSGAGPRDAITTQALEFRKLFAGWGWGGQDYAVRVAPGLNGAISGLRRLAPGRDHVLLIHHSAGLPKMRELLALPNPKLLLYHNVTPSEWLWEQVPVVAAHCLVGREQLRELVPGVDVAAGVSAFNARELEAAGASEVRVVPLFVRPERLGAGAGGDPDGPPVVLFVGRLSPHKRQDDVIRAFALYRRQHAPDARLVLVGDPVTPAYGRSLRALADTVAPGGVTIETGLSDAQLGARYRAAHVFLCLSEHEGFCAPVLEAFQFGVPVVARAAGAIPEVADGAALLVWEGDLGVVAELLHAAVSDVELRAELRCRAEDRLRAYAPAAVAEQLRAAVEATAATRVPRAAAH